MDGWMTLKVTHLSIKGLTGSNAYQSKSLNMRSKELPAGLRDRIVARQRFCWIEGSQEHSTLCNSQMEEV